MPFQHEMVASFKCAYRSICDEFHSEYFSEKYMVSRVTLDDDHAGGRRWEEAAKASYRAWAESQFAGQGIEATTIVPAISAGARLV